MFAGPAPFLTLASETRFSLTPAGAFTVTNPKGGHLWSSDTGPYDCTPGDLVSFGGNVNGTGPALVLTVAGQTMWTSNNSSAEVGVAAGEQQSPDFIDGTVVDPQQPGDAKLVFANEPYMTIYSEYGEVLWQALGPDIPDPPK
jgi:hypothetical protein